jgi:2-polyprenyl-3-methyl-5-hydroxy-6-metoxy-1,4-benzoquinol methylase
MRNNSIGEQYYSQDRSAMLPFVPTTAKFILEVGCANGSFGEKIKTRQECRYYGIEPHELSAGEAATKLDQVFNCFFENAPIPAGMQFDCIVFNDVLEHLPDPWLALRSCQRLLGSNGVIVCSIPNFLYWPVLREIVVNRDWVHTEWGVLDRTHRWFFTPKSMRRMMQSTGYKVVQMEGMKNYKSRAFGILNFVLMNRLEDYRYMQFALVCKMDQ